MIEIDGDWIGYYTYGEQYGLWGKGQRVPFRITIDRAVHEFTGRIVEDVEHGGIDDDAFIRGRQYGDEIEFEKLYEGAQPGRTIRVAVAGDCRTHGCLLPWQIRFK